jgi:2-oxo-3-hexenedioate decarboxylase
MLADELIEVHENPRQVALFTERYPALTAAQGYEAALALHRHRLTLGWRPVGRKIGFTNRTIWPRYGVYEPIWGTVYDRTMAWSQGDEAEVVLHGLVQPRIEPEICFGLRSAPPRTDDPEKLLASIEWIAHCVEVVQCHHPHWKVTLADSTADNGLHGRLVVGTPVPIAGLRHLAETLPKLQVTLRKNSAIVDRGVGANVLGSPLLALAYLVQVLSGQPAAQPLAPGELISTGTLTDAHPVSPGELWSTELSGLPLPGLTIRFK